VARLPAEAWARRSAGEGRHGPRWYDWAWLPAVYGAWISPDRCYRRWAATGLWPRILYALQESEADV
jgi:hypothetical protein